MSNAKNYGEAEPKTWEEQDFSCEAEAGFPQGWADTSSVAADRARVMQALRDLRHRLPPEGVAIVDEALAGGRFSDEAPLFESGGESALPRIVN
jgi:hypothetical protein